MTDTFGYDPDEDEGSPPPAEDKTAKDAEARANRLEAQNRKAQKELEELRGFKAQYEANQRKAEVSQALTDAGLPGGTAAAWLAMHPDQEINEETVSAFAETLGLSPQTSSATPSSEAPAQNRPPQNPGSTPPVEWHNPQVAGTSTVAPPKMPFKELDQLMRTNPAAARQAIEEGRAELDVVRGEGGAWGLPLKGTIHG